MTSETTHALRVRIEAALDHSGNYANANPYLSKTGREHILGLCKLLRDASAALAALAASQEAPKAGDRLSRLAEYLDVWANECEDTEDADDGSFAVFVPHTLSGDFYDVLKDAAAALRAAPTPPASQGDAAPAGDAVRVLEECITDEKAEWTGDLREAAWRALDDVRHRFIAALAAAPSPAVREAVGAIFVLRGKRHFSQATTPEQVAQFQRDNPAGWEFAGWLYTAPTFKNHIEAIRAKLVEMAENWRAGRYLDGTKTLWDAGAHASDGMEACADNVDEFLSTAITTPPAEATEPAPAVGREAVDDSEPTREERIATLKALSALDALSEAWADEIDLDSMCAKLAHANDVPAAIRAMVVQAYVEGAYAGRTSHRDAPPTPAADGNGGESAR